MRVPLARLVSELFKQLANVKAMVRKRGIAGPSFEARAVIVE
jgi:hypothetical protein